jgi:peptide/nickel transport system permease protein
MSRFLVRRTGAALLTLLVTSLVVFVTTSVVPGDVARTILGREASQESVDALRTDLGLDRPVLVQYLDWLGDFLTGDWGHSYTLGLDVRPLVLDRTWQSLQLAGLAFVVLVPVALVTGTWAGLRRGTRTDRSIVVTGLVGSSLPEFVTGVVLLVVFSVQLGWFPISAAGADGWARLQAMVLPAVALLFVTFGYVSRMVRANVISTLDSPHVRTAEIKGLPQRQIVRHHVLRNSLVTPITALGVQLRYLIGGLVTVELLFNYPGVGALLLDSAIDKDLPTLQATTMVLGVLLIATFILTDLLYSVLDPRVRLAREDT